ncbi:hypothetical protein A6M21_02285 [Desulfotomaculum copahuensis]|uniref:Uncharacterized protein n=1 Tax=Desulfotomaculum copahuensis TaxID=1838280 RepID=A0A1B7LJF0_9FIRM|nr:hypothetical protein A6M21_02285 [Desulfotomaculum copahuensis]
MTFLGRRATIRDYLDIYYLFKLGIITLEEIISSANKKYIINHENVFSTRLFLEQIIYMKDLEDKDVAPNLLFSSLSPNEIENYFKSMVENYLNKHVIKQSN